MHSTIALDQVLAVVLKIVVRELELDGAFLHGRFPKQLRRGA